MISSSIFQQARERVSARSAAERYGLTIDRAGRALCPFHPDRHPSMSFHNGRFRCWSCGASGSSVDLVARLTGLDAVGAVQRLNEDFHLALPLDKPLTPAERRQAQQEARKRQQLQAVRQEYDAWRQETVRRLCGVFRTAHEALLSIETPADLDRLTDAQVEAIRWQPWADWAAGILADGSMAEQIELFRERNEVERICNRILKPTPTRSGRD